MLSHVIKELVKKFIPAFYYMFRAFPIKNNKIVIVNFYGKGYGDNGKYIVKELLSRNRNYDIVWLAREVTGDYPENVRVVPFYSLHSIYEQVTAKIWIDNARKQSYVRKRKKQYYIMTWHGGLGIKKIEKEVENQLPYSYIKMAKHDSQLIDLMLAESKFTYWKYHTQFWYQGEILKCGTPRQDILFHEPKGLKKSVLQHLGLDERVHIFLYAPTFRDHMTEQDLNVYKRDWTNILKAASYRFGGHWIGFIRLHPNIAKLDRSHNLAEKDVYDVTSYPDMQELLCISDLALTDYSSSIYDFALMGRPAFMLVSDLKAYINQRDIGLGSHGLEVVPFPIAESDKQLVKAIKEFDMENYKKNIRHFYYDICGLYPGGHASEIIADRIDQIIGAKSSKKL